MLESSGIAWIGIRYCVISHGTHTAPSGSRDSDEKKGKREDYGRMGLQLRQGENPFMSLACQWEECLLDRAVFS